jgi:hypothetical protein
VATFEGLVAPNVEWCPAARTGYLNLLCGIVELKTSPGGGSAGGVTLVFLTLPLWLPLFWLFILVRLVITMGSTDPSSRALSRISSAMKPSCQISEFGNTILIGMNPVLNRCALAVSPIGDRRRFDVTLGYA